MTVRCYNCSILSLVVVNCCLSLIYKLDFTIGIFGKENIVPTGLSASCGFGCPLGVTGRIPCGEWGSSPRTQPWGLLSSGGLPLAFASVKGWLQSCKWKFGFVSILGALLPSGEGISLLVPAGWVPGGHGVQSERREHAQPLPRGQATQACEPLFLCVLVQGGAGVPQMGENLTDSKEARFRKRFLLPSVRKGSRCLCPPVVPHPVIAKMLTCVHL